MPAAIDTLKFAKRLEASRMPAAQAEAFAEAVADVTLSGLVTKDDLERAIERLELRINERFAQLDARIAQLQVRLMTMMGAGFVTTVGIVSVVIQFAHR